MLRLASGVDELRHTSEVDCGENYDPSFSAQRASDHTTVSACIFKAVIGYVPRGPNVAGLGVLRKTLGVVSDAEQGLSYFCICTAPAHISSFIHDADCQRNECTRTKQDHAAHSGRQALLRRVTVQLRNPILINDVHQQPSLLDRRDVYRKLAEHLVPTPQHIVVNRTAEQAAAGEDPEGFVETPDYVAQV